MEEHEKTLVRWLEEKDPDEWHQVAIDWNWDAGLDVLGWIAAQRECDRATAQHLILQGGADAFRGIPDRQTLIATQAYNQEPFDLLSATIYRWHSGFYMRNEIATCEPKQVKRLERAYRLGIERGDVMPWRLDEGIFEILPGREFSYRYAEGWPPEVEDDLRSRDIPY